MYVLSITSILGRLPVVRAGDMGTIPFSYRSGCSNDAHSYNHDLASADSNRGAGDGCPMYFMNSWALGWSSDPRSAMKYSVWNFLLHFITYYVIWLQLLRISAFHCYYVLLQIHCYVLSHHNYIIITSGKSCNNDYYYLLCKGKHSLLHYYYELLHRYHIIITKRLLFQSPELADVETAQGHSLK